MATAAQIKALVESHSLGDGGRFRAVALEVADGAEKSGRSRHAREIRDLLDARRLHAGRRATDTAAHTVPLAQPRSELAQVLTVAHPAWQLADMALGSDVMTRLQRVLAEQRRQDVLRAKGFEPSRRLLLAGQSGTGKSMTAHVLAFDLALPVSTVHLSRLTELPPADGIDRLRLVFDLVSQARGVYLFDEIDALLTAGDGHRDVFRTFTALLSHDASSSLLVTTTNQPQLLDRSVLRRFDLLVEYPLPTTGVVHEVVLRRLRGFDLAAVEWPRVASTASGLSHEEVSAAAQLAAKQSILEGKKHIETAALLSALRERRQMLKMAP